MRDLINNFKNIEANLVEVNEKSDAVKEYEARHREKVKEYYQKKREKENAERG